MEVNEEEKELTIVTSTLVITLLIENTNVLHATMNELKRVIDIGRVWGLRGLVI